MGLFIVAALSFGFGLILASVALLQLLILPSFRAVLGASFLLMFVAFMFWRQGPARPHFPFPVFPECQLHFTVVKVEICKAVGKCKISGYLRDYRSTSRETHPTHRNKINVLYDVHIFSVDKYKIFLLLSSGTRLP